MQTTKITRQAGEELHEGTTELRAWLLMSEFELAGIWGGIGVGLGVTGVLLLILLIFAIQKHRTIDPLAVAAS